MGTETADLVIVVGTSLGGLNADRVAVECAKRSRTNRPYGKGGALGTVIINLQQTVQDGKASLRMFGTTDCVLTQVLVEMGLAKIKSCGVHHSGNITRVKLTEGHNVQGAKQPQYMHIGAGKPYKHRGVVMQPGPGTGTVVGEIQGHSAYQLQIEGARMKLGVWW